ncbi:MAG: transporter [Rhodocyclaceae bacterium]|nr:transporter [Rhodocyclaceae bacterium]
MSPPNPHEASYGSDAHGLVWAYAFLPGARATRIDLAAIPQWADLCGDAPDAPFYWLHFAWANVASETWMREHLRLPTAFYDTARHGAASTRLEQEGDALLAVLHDILFDFSFDSSAVSTVHLCILPRLLVSARVKPLRSIDRLRHAVERGARFRSPTDLLVHLLLEQASALVDIARQSSSRVDGIEDTLLANRLAVSRSELGSLRRILVRLQRLLAPEPAALFRLLNRPPAWVAERDIAELRQAAEEFSAATADAAALVERVKLLQEEVAARLSEQTNRNLFVLTIVTVMALPISLVGGLFGMNVKGIPLSESEHGFAIIIALLIVVTLLLARFAFSRSRDR